MRCVPQLKRNLISIGALKALGLEVSSRDNVLKIIKGSMVVLKGVRHNNFYYLKGNTVIRQVASSTNSDGLHSTLTYEARTGRKNSLQAFAE